MDGARVDKLQTFYLSQRRVDVWSVYVGDTDVWSKAVSRCEE